MTKIYSKILSLLVVFLHLSNTADIKAQSVIFNEAIGAVTATTAISAWTGWTNGVGLTFSSGGATNPGDVRTSSASTGYSGASGTGNVFLSATSGNYGFSIESINAAAYSNLQLYFAYRKESASALATVALDYWNGSTWVNVPFTFAQAANAAGAWYANPAISLPVGAQINGLKIRFVKSGTVAIRLDDIKLMGTLPPAVSISGSPNSLTTTEGTASSETSFTVSGSNLTGDLTVTPPAGFEITTTSGSGYASSVVLTPSSGAVASTTVYIRLIGSTAGTYSGNITASSTGASSATITMPISTVNSSGALDQTITFGALSNVTYGNSTITLAASASSGLAVSYTSSNTAVATVSGNTVTIVGAGSTTITASQAGDGSYNPAPAVNQTLVVDPVALTITSPAVTDKVYNGTNAAVITGTLSGIIGSDVVTLVGTGTFATTGVGNGIAVTSTSTLAGAQAGNYTLVQPTGLTGNILGGTQIINFTALSTYSTATSTFNLGATTNATGATISYTSSNTAVATVSGNVVTIVGPGSTSITASSGAFGNYAAAADVTQSLSVVSALLAWDFFGTNTTTPYVVSANPTYIITGLGTASSSPLTRGSAAAASSGANSFRTTGFLNDGIATSNSDYFQFTVSPQIGTAVSLTSIDARFNGTASYYAAPGVTSQFAYSTDGTSFTLIGSPVQSTSLTMTQVDLSGVTALQNVQPGTTVTMRYYASGQTGTGGWGFNSPSAGTMGLIIGGVTTALPCPFYQDNDGDGYGNPSVSINATCGSSQVGYVELINTDCNDNDNAIKPGATELPCNATDDNCNGTTDENFVAGCNDPAACNYVASATCSATCDYTQQIYYQDLDVDGYGNNAVTQVSCTAPSGYVLAGGDCDDNNPGFNPGAVDVICNNGDENCNGIIDDGAVNGCMDINATNYNALATCNSGCSYVDFTAGNVVVYRIGNGTGTLGSGATASYLDEVNTTGIVRSLSVPIAGSARLTNAGSSTSEGLLTRTADQSKLVFGGYDAAVGTTTVTTTAGINRVINTIGISPASMTRVASGTYFAGGNFRGACGTGTNYWGSGSNTGIAYFGSGTAALVSTTTTNTRYCNVQNGQLYYSTGSGATRGVYKVGVGTPLVSGTVSTIVINQGATGDPYGFQFSLDGNTCYIADNTTGIEKWTYNGSTWTKVLTIPLGTGFGAKGIAVDFYAGVNPRIYAIATSTAQTNIIYFDDNGTTTPTINTISSLTNATANKAYRGIAFAPCTPSTWYADADGDGFGALANTLSYCTQPYGYVSNSTDCDDAVAASNPNATEICDGLDNDCNGTADDGLTFTIYYHDNDGDTYGAGLPTSACQSPGAGYVTNNTDCDDAQAAANPGAVEICDALDNDCNSSVDDGLTFTNYYHDNDGDTYGAGLATNACQSPGAGYVTNNTDCDDATAAVNPGAVEVCNAIDDDCVGGADNGLTFVNYYNDQDGDTYGSGTVLNSCQSPGGSYVTVNGDCDDASAAINPTATETCNNIDDDCDGTADDGLTFVNYYNDQDGDTYGAGTAINACQSPGASYVTNNSDCDDAAVNTHPGAAEICNSIDDDCDGTTDDGLTFVNYYNDGDGDGYGAGAATNACQSPGATYVTNNTDCNDGNSAINPGATDICNNTIDEDCSGADCVSGINAAVLINNIGQYGTGIQATQTVNLSLGANTIESPGVGNDVWYKFVAQNNAIRVALTGSTTAADDNDLGLYNNPSTIGVQMIPISTENDVHPTALGVSADGGNEIMYYSNLVSGNTYYLLVRNNNANPGTCTLTVSYLKGSQAEVGPYTGGTGIYNTTCQSFKGAFRPNGTNYTVNRWADVTATGTPVWTYVIPSNSTICQLGKILPPNMSGSQVSYPVTVDVTYNLPDAFGNMNTINARGNVVTSVMLNSEASLFVRTTDACPAFKSPTSGTVATNRSVCGIDRYEWQFTEANAQGVATGLPNLTPIYGAAGASRLLTLVSVPGMAGAKFYNVKIRTKHTDGVSLSSWGNNSCVKTIGAAGMAVENNEAIGQTLSNGADVLIFPNPNNGQGVTLQINGMDGDLMVRVTDASGKTVLMDRYVVEGALNTTLNFNQALSSGLYQVELINGPVRNTLRMSVVR